MRLVADTSALLSLACSRFFEIILREHTVFITNSVYKELIQFALYDDFLGKKAKELLKKKLKLKNPRRVVKLSLEITETDVFSLAKEIGCIALTDDVRAARIVKEKLKLKTMPSFYLLLLLYKKGRITNEDLAEDMQSILKYRNWLSGALWEYAIGLIEKL